MAFQKQLTSVFALLVILGLAACTPLAGPLPSTGSTATPAPTIVIPTPAVTAPSVSSSSLENTSWQLVSMGPAGSPSPLVAGSSVTLNFQPGGQAGGSGGCNSYGGNYAVQGNTISFSQIIQTMMACADQAVNDQESQFFKALQSSGQFQQSGDQLTIQYNNGQDVLNFVRAASTPVAQTSQPQATSIGSEGGAATSTSVGSSGGNSSANPTPAPVIPNSDKYPYIDNRSGPVEVLTSLFNAINRKEYDRAYSYWESGVNGLPPYDQFKAGYASTESVELFTGPVGGGVGAGQYYYSVPVVLVSKTTGGQTQTFAGCYTLHLANPIIQDAPPYDPMAIQSANIQQVANNADRAPLLAKNCTP